MTLHDRDALLPRERQRRFLESEGWTAWSGPARRRIPRAVLPAQPDARGRLRHRRPAGHPGRHRRADPDRRRLGRHHRASGLGARDPPRGAQRRGLRAHPARRALRPGRRLDRDEPHLARGRAAGCGGAATAPRCRTTSSPPSRSSRARARADRHRQRSAARPRRTELGIGATRLVVGTARRAVRAARGVVTEAPAQLPRLQRIEQLDPSTRISLGLLLDEQARRNHDEICFLFGDRAHRQDEVKHRVDSVVKGLISVGVRQGDRVGVLMDTRPSAFTVIAALSRLGATAVLLRPDAEVDREAKLGRIDLGRSPTPSTSVAAAELDGVRCLRARRRRRRSRRCPAGVDRHGAHRPGRGRGAGLVQARIRTAPATSRSCCSPARAPGTKAIQITNKRWALSALGTASAAALQLGRHRLQHHADPPLVRAADDGRRRGRRAARGSRWRPPTIRDTFWDEVRRYGATHVSYTWTSLRDITYAPENPNERFNPIRMFIGSGMPRNLWTRVAERFPDARILEFYASAEGEAILANLTGQKPGLDGHARCPGTAEVRVAAFDLADRASSSPRDGLARECLADEVGLLLTPGARRATSGGGPIAARRVRHRRRVALDRRPVPARRPGRPLAGRVGGGGRRHRGRPGAAGRRAVLPRQPSRPSIWSSRTACRTATRTWSSARSRCCPDTELSAADARHGAWTGCPRAQRPRYVQVVPSIPLTTWHRPIWRDLQRSAACRSRRGVAGCGSIDRRHRPLRPS